MSDGNVRSAQHDQRSHRPGELGAGAGEQRARRGAVRRAGQVDGAAVVPAPVAGQQDVVVPRPARPLPPHAARAHAPRLLMQRPQAAGCGYSRKAYASLYLRFITLHDMTM